MINDVTVVVRSIGERTEQVCKKIIIDSGVPKDSVFIVSERPFSLCMKKSFELGILQNKKWTFCCDADVLLKSNSLNDLISVANKQPDNVFEIQGYVLDKFFGGMRTAGNHLYRTSLLNQCMGYIPEEGVDIRPEYNMLKQMNKLGYPWVLVPVVMGLHDFEQYNKDIYRKSFVQSRKHLKFTDMFIPYWNRYKGGDNDFEVALSGYLNGLQYNGMIYINDTDPVFRDKYNEEGMHEKKPLTSYEYSSSIVDGIIDSWANSKEYVDNFPVTFSAVKYSNPVKTAFMKMKLASKEIGSFNAIIYYVGNLSYLIGKKLIKISRR